MRKNSRATKNQIMNVNIATPSVMPQVNRSGARRYGDEFQDVQSLDVLVEWLENTTRYQWISLEANDNGSLDDIIAYRADSTAEAWQVKYSTNPAAPKDPYNWEILLHQEKGAGKKLLNSLLQKWFSTWQGLSAQNTSLNGGLISNRRETAELCLDAGRNGFVQWDALAPTIRQRLLDQLGAESDVRAFFGAFRFRLNEPSLRDLEAGVRRRFARLGGTSAGWYHLWEKARQWTNLKNDPAPDGHITLDDVLRAARLRLVNFRVFLPPFVYFEPHLNSNRLFHHRLPQIGRRETLNDLLSFVSSQSRVGILSGRGGNGKSKLIHTLCRRLDKREATLAIRLKAEGLSIDSDGVRELPDGRTLVIVDDAHRSEGLETLLACARRNSDLQVLLVTRTHATQYLKTQTCRAGFDDSEITVFPNLTDLSYPKEIRRLARVVLGDGKRKHADTLAKLTRDCPLLTVVGGQMLRNQQIAPELLLRSQEFRHHVLQHFQDIVFGEFVEKMNGQFSTELCAAVLPLIAVTTPLDLDDSKLLEAIAALAGTDTVKLKQLIGAMIEADVLVRGGEMVRIVPDVLSDFILHKACITADGESSGWAERTYLALADLRLDPVLRNLAELDWRIRTATDTKSQVGQESILDGVWNDIENRFRSALQPQRQTWLFRLQRMAFIAPHRLWRLAEIVRDEPGAEDPNEVSPAYKGQLKTTSQSDVISSLIPILRGIASDARYTARCADWLWEMGRDEEVAPNQTPAALVALREIAGYQWNKPYALSAIVLDCCREWMRDSHIHLYRDSFTEILAALLSRNVYESWPADHVYGNNANDLGSINFQDLQRETFQLFEQCALSGVRREVLLALSKIQDVLSEHDLYGLREDHPEEWDAWEEEMQLALQIIQKVAESNDDPFVCLQIWEVLQYQAANGPRPNVRQQARDILESLPHSFKMRFILLLTGHHEQDKFRASWLDDDYQDEVERDASQLVRAQQQRDARRDIYARKLIEEWVERFPEPEAGFRNFNDWIEEVEISGWWKEFWTRRNPFTVQLATDFPNYAKVWCELALENPETPAACKIADILCQLRRHDEKSATELVQKIMAQAHPNLLLRVAESYSSVDWAQNPQSSEWTVVEQLLGSEHPQVKSSAAHIAVAIASVKPRRALDIVLKTDLREDGQFAEKFYAIFDPHRGIDIPNPSSSEMKDLLEKLKNVNAVNTYHLGIFFLIAALRDPVAVAETLVHRVRHKCELAEEGDAVLSDDFGLLAIRERGVNNTFRALPEAGFHDEKLNTIENHADYPKALRYIRDASLDPRCRHDSVWQETLPELFRDFSLGFGSTSLEVLGEWIQSDDPIRIKAAVGLLADSSMKLYFGDPRFVNEFLHAAQGCGRDCLESVERRLKGYVIFGSRRGAAPRRGERSNALFQGVVVASLSGAEFSEIDEGISEQFEAGMEDLHGFKAHNQSSKLVFPGKSAFDGETQDINLFIEEAFATPFSLFAVARVLLDVGSQTVIPHALAIGLGVKTRIQIQHAARNIQAQRAAQASQRVERIGQKHRVVAVHRRDDQWRDDVTVVVTDGDCLLAFLMFVAAVANASAPFFATVLLPSPCKTERSSLSCCSSRFTEASNTLSIEPSRAQRA